MNWTEEQLQTIETQGKNILVSAAAGSGKTTVLVERIKNLVLNVGADIDSFLITTFTKAAAGEMKERLEKAIRDEMKKPDADRKALLRQLQKLPGASISTFHSFAIDIIRQYFYLTDLEPGFGIADDIQVSIMKTEALDELFAGRYEKDYDRFSRFILKYSSERGDGRLKDNILDTYKTLVSISGYFDWAREKAQVLKAEHPMENLDAYDVIGRKIAEGFRQSARFYREAAEMIDSEAYPFLYGKASEDSELIEEIAERAEETLLREGLTAEDIEAFAKTAFNYKLNTMSVKKNKEEPLDDEFKEILSSKRKGGKAVIDKLKSDFFSRSFQSFEEDLGDIYEDTIYYIEMIEEFEAILKEKKGKAGVIDFDDIMHYAIQVVSNPKAAEELREKYRYIFIDEYQDSNYLQEEIIEKIAGSNNLFMVGDVKQCIYKFRLAEPEIFGEKARRYSQDGENSLLLNLNSNFRSKVNVTEPVNDVFRELMEGYDEKAELKSTAPAEHRGFPARMHIIDREDFDDSAPEKSHSEAAVITNIIKEKLGQEIYDTKAGTMRRLRLKDFAVIARNNRTVEEVERYLINEGLPAYGEGSGKYFETVEVQVFINILKVIENMGQDVPLISAMRSVVFGFTPREMALIRTQFRDGSFNSAVRSYGEEGDIEELRDKIAGMIEKLSLWKEISRTVPIDELMKKVLFETGYYDYCSGLPVGRQRISNLRLISEKASKYEQLSHGGLYGFLRYIDAMKGSGESDTEAKIISESEDVVRVMSVHKSKGLEFPVVIFANAGKKTDTAVGEMPITIHREYGIGLPKINLEEHWHRKTYIQKLIDDLKKREKIEEEIRILYVALTRAKDSLEIVGTVKKKESLSEETSTKNFLSMIYPSFAEREEVEIILYDDAQMLVSQEAVKGGSVDKLFAMVNDHSRKERSQEEEVFAREVDRRLSYDYPYAQEQRIKPKYSVTELNGHRSEEREAPAIAPLRKKETRERFTAAQIGTLMHLVMERISFTKAVFERKEHIRDVVAGLLAQGTITPEEYDVIDIDKIDGFFDGEIGKRAAEAEARGQLYREKEFVLLKEIDGAETVVQGIIDCFFIEDGKTVILDYKNSAMWQGRSEEDVIETYRNQIELYREAVEAAGKPQVKEAYLYLFKTKKLLPLL